MDEEERKRRAREYQKRYAATEHGRARIRAYARAYYRTPKGQANSKKQRAKQDPKVKLARLQAQRAKASGRLIQQPCQVCGEPKTDMHHPNGYEDPLDVIWLCRPHHIVLHAKRKY